MDPFSLTAGAIQIAAACAQCTVTIIKWVGDVRTVDARISSFCDEVSALRATYEGLEHSLSSPLMAEAARIASKTSDGGPLWLQIREILDDSKKTMKRVNEVLTHIASTSGFARRIKAQLQESLASGELLYLRQRIQVFNSSLSLPIQMVCVMLQLEQRGISVENQIALDKKLISLEKSIQELVQALSTPSNSGSTLVASDIDSSGRAGMEAYMAFAHKFLTTASAAASTRSSLSTISQPNVPLEHRRLSGVGLSDDNKARVAGWIPPPPPPPPPPPRESRRPTDHEQRRPITPSPRLEVPKTIGAEVEFLRTKRHLDLGQERLQQDQHVAAETHFRKALALMKGHDFQGKISLQPADIVLMVADCCLKQQKFDESINLLKPVTEMRDVLCAEDSKSTIVQSHPPGHESHKPDRLQALAGDHMLGLTYMLKEEYEIAEKHVMKAFTERRKDLGPRDTKTIESVKLLIEIHRAQGDEEEAEGWEVFLVEPTEELEKAPITTPTIEKVISFNDSPPSSVPRSQIRHSSLPVKRSGRTSFAEKLRHFRKPSQTTVGQSLPVSDIQRLSLAGTSTSGGPNDPELFEGYLDHVQATSSPSIDSTQEKSHSFNEDESVSLLSVDRLDRSLSSRTIEPTFVAVAQLCVERRYDRAVKVALGFLNTYNSNVMILRKNEIEKNIRKGDGIGLARTGFGYAPLHFFCELKDEHVEEVHLLIKQGVDVNAVAFQAGYTPNNPRGAFTALGRATERGFSNITAILLASPGIRTDVEDSSDTTPIMVACRKGYHTIVRQLLRFPMPATFPNSWYGNSLLHDAARRCDAAIVELLLEHDNCDVDAPDQFGKTALMHAVIKTDISDPVERRRRIHERCTTVQLLLSMGADPHALNRKTGLSVLDYVSKEHDNDLSRIIKGEVARHVSELPT
ncbi:hypothetical protein B0A52_09674 [Exophiala mesophila]|uniref:Uncharacterized protein n=1 Tax=Exophiala mesophila TaxID=212818 RepID=A0A438MS28_EXOME|nr:hypothetical protein B0A52_09674 [Exophiala mesophila]